MAAIADVKRFPSGSIFCRWENFYDYNFTW